MARVGKAHPFRQPHEPHQPGRAVAVLSDEDVRLAGVGALVIDDGPVEEQHGVGVLFELPGLSQVSEARDLVLSRLQVARELGDGDDRDGKLTLPSASVPG